MSSEAKTFSPRPIDLRDTDGWILPDGSFYPCASDEHDQCARYILTLFTLDELTAADIDPSQRTARMNARDLGCVQFSYGVLQLQLGITLTESQVNQLQLGGVEIKHFSSIAWVILEPMLKKFLDQSPLQEPFRDHLLNFLKDHCQATFQYFYDWNNPEERNKYNYSSTFFSQLTQLLQIHPTSIFLCPTRSGDNTFQIAELPPIEGKVIYLVSRHHRHNDEFGAGEDKFIAFMDDQELRSSYGVNVANLKNSPRKFVPKKRYE